MNLSQALKLARFDKPVGIVLLWAPTAWALWLANQGHPPLGLLLWFLLGTIFMRAAGCIVNDIADRELDPFVKRTQKRLLATKEVSLFQALLLLLLFLFLALLVLCQLPFDCVYFALISLLVTAVYPFCKRFIQCPQLVLGLAFSLGIPMAYAASGALSSPTMYYLLAINIAWILVYDTEYAMVDRDDDLLIGIKSSAILFGSKDRQIIAGLQALFHLLWMGLALVMDFSWPFYLAWGMALFILLYQQRLLASVSRDNYFKAFASNNWYGMLLWVGLIFAF